MGEERLHGLAKLYLHRELTNGDLIENFVTVVIGILKKQRKKVPPPIKLFSRSATVHSYSFWTPEF